MKVEQFNQDDLCAFLGEGAKFEGTLCFEGALRIDGEFKGEISSHDFLVLGPDSKVSAKIKAHTVLLGGKFEGEIEAFHKVEILKSGDVRGSIVAPFFKIEEGGYFDGSTRVPKGLEPSAK